MRRSGFGESTGNGTNKLILLLIGALFLLMWLMTRKSNFGVYPDCDDITLGLSKETTKYVVTNDTSYDLILKQSDNGDKCLKVSEGSTRDEVYLGDNDYNLLIVNENLTFKIPSRVLKENKTTDNSLSINRIINNVEPNIMECTIGTKDYTITSGDNGSINKVP